MQISHTRALSVVVALAYLLTAVITSGWDSRGIAILSVGMALPLAFIWFPDEMAAYAAALAKGPYSRFNSETPATIVTFVGWFLLVGLMPLIAYLLVR